jgi:hypothetical protein
MITRCAQALSKRMPSALHDEIFATFSKIHPFLAELCKSRALGNTPALPRSATFTKLDRA